MALDRNGARLSAGDQVKIYRDSPFYGGSIAEVLDTHPFHAVSVRMFNGREFRMSSRDTTKQR